MKEKCDELHKNMMNILLLIQNKDKYKDKLVIDGTKLGGYIDNYFRKLLQQKQDNEKDELLFVIYLSRKMLAVVMVPYYIPFFYNIWE